jgi:Tat protein translocase TatB subunit
VFGIGWQELLVIFLVILIFIGPKKLPEVAKQIAKAIREFARTKEQVKRTIENHLLEIQRENSYLEIKEKDDGKGNSETIHEQNKENQ